MDFLIPSSPEPDSYPTHTTPISTRKAYDKRSRTKKTGKEERRGRTNEER